MEQTAIDWLIEQIEQYRLTHGHTPLHKLYQLKKEAKAMEKEHHGATWDAAIKAHDDRGHVYSRSLVDFDEWYEQQFKK